jgi:threonine dehydrogenase-like Zn-dependent dehydrogenase
LKAESNVKSEHKRSARLRFTQRAWSALCRHHRHGGPREQASVAFARVVDAPSGSIFLIDEDDLLLFAPEQYVVHGGANVRVSPEAMRRTMWAYAQSGRTGFVSVHDHWFSRQGTTFSSFDDADDIAHDRYLRTDFEPTLRAHPEWGRPRNVAHLSVVLDQSSVDARTVDSRLPRPFAPVRAISVCSDSWLCFRPNSGKAAVVRAARGAAPHARHSDFITPEQQETLGSLTVGLIGCGGVGAAIAENLARLGVGELVLVDPDALSETNLNRWPSASPKDVGRTKVSLLARRLRRQTPWARLRAVATDALDPVAAMSLTDCDVLVCAVDNDAARFWANRLALQTLVPMFDVGVRVQARPVMNFSWRIVPVVPGVTACLECSGLAALDRLEIAKSLDGATRAVRENAGYVQGADVAAPSVMGINYIAAGNVCLEVLSYLCGYLGRPSVRIGHWRTARTTVVEHDHHLPSADCPACAELLAAGLDEPLPRRRSPEEAQRAFAALKAELASPFER